MVPGAAVGGAGMLVRTVSAKTAETLGVPIVIEKSRRIKLSKTKFEVDSIDKKVVCFRLG